MRSRAGNGNDETCKTVNGKIVTVAPGDFVGAALALPRLRLIDTPVGTMKIIPSGLFFSPCATVSCAAGEKSSLARGSNYFREFRAENDAR